MTKEELTKLKSYFHGILEQKRVFEDAREKVNIQHAPVEVLKSTFDEIEQNFPGLIPKFNPSDFFSHSFQQNRYYKIDGIRAFIGMVIGKLQVQIENDETTPITQKREFPFISDSDVKKIIGRDYSEIQRAFISKCWKSVIILSGSAIEAILLDLLLGNETRAKSSSKAPQKSDLRKWDLKNLIEVAIDLKLVSDGIDKLSHSVREYRNLVHPGNEIINKLVFGEEEAKIAIEVLHILHRDLSS